MPDRDRPLYAVLIDADNIPAKFAEDILKEITGLGEPALRRVYGDWSSGRLANWAKEARSLGLVAHQDSANTTGKNASDIGLVIDAMDILHSGRFDGFVIVSSDSDFTALANRIREQGLEVIGIGDQQTPASLRNVCNRFIHIKNIVSDEPDGQNAEPASEKRNPSEAVPRIRKAMASIENDGEWYAFSRIGKAVRALYPDWDYRTYGKTGLRDLLASMKQEFETRDTNGTAEVRFAPKG